MGSADLMKQSTKKEEKEKDRMPNVWFSLKRSFHCMPQQDEVIDKEARGHNNSIFNMRLGWSGCSKSIANLKDVIHGNTRQLERPKVCSPSSIGSSEFINPIKHEVILLEEDIGEVSSVTPPRRSSHNGLVEYTDCSLACDKCGEKILRFEDLEAHHSSKHAVTELIEGDSSRKIVEIICRTNLSKSQTSHINTIDRILKVHSTQKILARFEEHRETIKNKVSNIPKKHPRCLADGNELLRFHGTTIVCNLGIDGSSTLCFSENCRVCRIIRNGFSANELRGGIGVFTTSTSESAIESIELHDDVVDDVYDDGDCLRKALLVCRVIAGRVHRPLENFKEIEGQSGFDSLAGKVGLYTNIEELYLLNPQALLPCFVVIFKA